MIPDSGPELLNRHFPAFFLRPSPIHDLFQPILHAFLQILFLPHSCILLVNDLSQLVLCAATVLLLQSRHLREPLPPQHLVQSDFSALGQRVEDAPLILVLGCVREVGVVLPENVDSTATEAKILQLLVVNE